MTDETPHTTRWLPPVASDPPPAPSPQPPAPPRIPLWAPFAALFGVLVVSNIFGAAIIGGVMAADPAIEDVDDLPNSVTLSLMLLQGAVFIFGAWITVRLALGSTPREQFGLTPVRHPGRAALWAAAMYAGFWFVTILLTVIFGDPDDQALVEDIRAEDSLPALVAAGFLICVLAPVAEELFFRGFMFTVLLRAIGVVRATAIVGVVFGLGHAAGAPLVSVAALAAFGVGLCILYWRAQSIIPCMALHALNNSITFGVVKSLDPALFAGVVVVSVGAVTAGAALVSARPRVAA